MGGFGEEAIPKLLTIGDPASLADNKVKAGESRN
jgi:hypothetical protein